MSEKSGRLVDFPRAAPPAAVADAVDPDLVRILARLLRLAEQGRVKSVVMASIVIGDDGATAFEISNHVENYGDARGLIGGLEIAKHRLAAWWDSGLNAETNPEPPKDSA